ncbi:histidine phosphatase family protein [Skermanella sp. TT6]|uniref:Histidine phosphatase family protein n=1 Tax=Skermanella cutis TaxID=2775420 RepID=A0ABX7B7R9_9PROT|nr:histidine phosphatase family protein [Skermanella sp. TT6]QQP90222.1 histidine phosphatase family protein [Skermanella sp. TT6]
MNPVTRWWLVRHAPVPNPEGRIHGQLDLEADCGDAPAFEGLARLLPSGAVRMVTTLSRTWRTAEAIWGAATDMTVEAGLLEQDFGAWQGFSHGELAAMDAGGRVARFWEAPATTRPPGGESFEQVVNRVALALERNSELHAGRDVVAVCHAGSIRAALAVALGIAPAAALSFQVDPLSVTRIDHIPLDGAKAVWRIVGVNRPPL